jgi:hypothetical protein
VLAIGCVLAVRFSDLKKYQVLKQLEKENFEVDISKLSTFESSRLLAEKFNTFEDYQTDKSPPEIIELENINKKVIKILYAYICLETLSNLSADHNPIICKAIQNKKAKLARKNLGHWRRVSILLLIEAISISLKRHRALKLTIEVSPSIGLKDKWLLSEKAITASALLQSILKREEFIFNAILETTFHFSKKTRFNWILRIYEDLPRELLRMEREIYKTGFTFLSAEKDRFEIKTQKMNHDKISFEHHISRVLKYNEKSGRPNSKSTKFKSTIKRNVPLKRITFSKVFSVFTQEYLKECKRMELKNLNANYERINILFSKNRAT